MSDPIFALLLNYSETNKGVPGRDQGWRISLVAQVKSGFADALVFRYQKISSEEVLFTGVCSPADLADYGPSPARENGFFRSATATLDFASQDDAYRVRDQVIADLTTLCNEMKRISANMSPVAVIEVSSEINTNVDPA